MLPYKPNPNSLYVKCQPSGKATGRETLPHTLIAPTNAQEERTSTLNSPISVGHNNSLEPTSILLPEPNP